MKKIFGLLLILPLLLFVGCGSDDDDDDGNGGNGTVTLQEVTANTSVSAPTLSSVNETVWNNVTPAAVDVSTATLPPTVAGVASASDSVYVQAIKTGGDLYLRLQWSDSDNDLWLHNWTILDDNYNFTHYVNLGRDEDMLLVMFDGAADGWDTWRWGSLTTGYVDVAEGMTWDGSELVSDSGANEVAKVNPEFAGRPKYVHETKAAFTGDVLYIDDTTSAYMTGNASNDGWAVGTQTVPGYLIDTAIVTWITGNPPHPESRWDSEAISSYSSGTYTVVMKRSLAGSNDIGSVDDLDMSELTRVKAKIGIFDNQIDIDAGSSNRGFTADFWLNL